MNEPIHPLKEDRYSSESSSKKSLSPLTNNLILSKKKWIILVFALLIILVTLSFIIFNPKEAPTSSLIDAIDTPETTQENLHEEANSQILEPPQISRDATETNQQDDLNQERIEVPGYVTDSLADKIEGINKQTDADKIILNSADDKVNKNTDEQPLQGTLENEHYTIQIIGGSSLENIMVFVKQHKISNYHIYETSRNKKPWFVLIKGNYSTREEAKKALTLLPKDLQKNQPWIKSGVQVNKEKLLQ